MVRVDEDYMLSFLREIIEIPSVGGSTERIMRRIKDEFDSLGVGYKETNKGAVYGIIKGEDDDHQVLINAHVDTLGGMVKEILKNGRLRMINIGGYTWNAYEGENLTVHAGNGNDISGTLLFEKGSVHIFSTEARETARTDENMEIRLDGNFKTDEDVRNAGIEVGDFVSFEPRYKEVNGFIKSRYLDDKACVAAMFAAIKYIKENSIKPAKTTMFYVANYEEIGHGVSFIPDNTVEMLSVDIGPVAKGQNSDERAVSILAKDSRSPYDEGFRRRLEKICRDSGIEYRVDIPRFYGSDASMSVVRGADVNFACVGPGVDATHHYERTTVEALMGTAALVLEYVKQG